MSHFIRGYFDGDGHISNSRGYQCNIVSSMDFCIGLSQFLEELDVHNKIIDVPTNKLSGRVCIYCKKDNKQFLDYIYKDAELYMERKYNVYINKYCSSNN